MSESADFPKEFKRTPEERLRNCFSEWKPLAEKGHAPAQSGLGMMYFTGQGVSKDYKTAVKWLNLLRNREIYLPRQSGLDTL